MLKIVTDTRIWEHSNKLTVSARRRLWLCYVIKHAEVSSVIWLTECIESSLYFVQRSICWTDVSVT